jgi:glycosyltransferase involved in cell wall biosynthesis
MYPLVSILTPTWNRADYLDRVWDGIDKQTYKNIEWIVADDGSTDNTLTVLNTLRRKSNFPVIIIKASLHIGKSRMDNEAISLAKGEFILWNDSDDYLLPHAIEKLVEAWENINEVDRKHFVGVTALCGDKQGVISSELPTKGIFDTTLNDLRMKYNVEGDMLHFTRSNYLKENKFPEVDFLIPEGVVWSKIGNLKTRIIPEIIQVKEYKALNCISFSKLMKYNRGMAYSQAICCENLKKYPKKNKDKFWDTINFIRYSIHGDISMINAINMWNKNTSFLYFLSSIPFAVLLAIKDITQGKVRKTHLEFLSASKSVEVSLVE